MPENRRTACGHDGYISKELFESLWEQGVQPGAKIKKNMKNKLMPMLDKLLLRKCALRETVNDQLKNIRQIEHTRHRSVANFVVNLLAALVAYSYQEKKPSLNLHPSSLIPSESLRPHPSALIPHPLRFPWPISLRRSAPVSSRSF